MIFSLTDLNKSLSFFQGLFKSIIETIISFFAVRSSMPGSCSFLLNLSVEPEVYFVGRGKLWRMLFTMWLF